MLLSRFREQLRASEWAERERVPLTAGLAILQVIAQRIDRHVVPDASDVEMARAVVETLPPSATARGLGALLQVIDQEPQGPAAPALMEYGKTLEDGSHYVLAADVYQLAAELGRREHGLLIAPAALNRVGACLRRVGRHREAEKAYRAAAAVAQEVGDGVSELLSEIGRAKVIMAEQRYAAAREPLDRVIASARRRELWHPLALALHERATIANHERDYESAVVYFAESLGLQREREPQIRLLADVGVTLHRLGLLDIARDVFVYVRAELPQPEAKASAAINLLAIAADQQQWADFDRWRRVLESEKLDVGRLCEFLETLAEGLDARGLESESRATYETLRETAHRGALREFEDSAQRALDKEHTGRTKPPTPKSLSQRCRPAIDVIRERVPVGA